MARTGIMLAHPLEEKRYAKWSQPSIIQPKLDGERCRAVFNSDGSVLLYSSENNVITSVPHINQQLENTGYREIEFDGELYIHGKPFETIQSIVSRSVNQHYASDSMDYHIFDIVSSDPQDIRLRALDLLLNPLHLENIKKVPSDYVTDIESIVTMLHEYEDLGYEGAIIRHPKAPYLRKRSPYMMKFKPRKSDIYRIAGYYEEMSIHGNLKGRLGSLICCGDEATFLELGHLQPNAKIPVGYFGVGSGFNEDERSVLWKEREGLVGKWCEVLYQHTTSKGRVPRFPVYASIKVDML